MLMDKVSACVRRYMTLIVESSRIYEMKITWQTMQGNVLQTLQDYVVAVLCY